MKDTGYMVVILKIVYAGIPVLLARVPRWTEVEVKLLFVEAKPFLEGYVLGGQS